jgi:probable F420-dependent oxidoreductase
MDGGSAEGGGVQGGGPTFGLCYDFRQAWPFAQDHGEFYAECLDEIEEGERLGFEAVWLSEHHLVEDGMLPSPLVAAAAIAARTRRLRIGTNVLVLPLHHPLQVAEDAAVVDLVSGGRLLLGVGQGYARHEFEAFGVDRSQRSSRLEEGVAVIRQAWTRGRTGFAGKHFRLEDLPFEPRPRRRIPIYLGAVAEPAVRRAVRIGDGLLVYCGRAADLPARYRALARLLDEQDRPAGSFGFVATGVLHVHAEADQAWREAAPAIAYQERRFAEWGADRDRPPPPPVRPEDLSRDDYLVGTPDQVAGSLLALHREAPFDQFAFWGRLPGLSHRQALGSMRLFAAEVAPVVRARLGEGVASGAEAHGATARR